MRRWRRRPRGPGKVSDARLYRTHRPKTRRRTPPTKTRRRKRKILPPAGGDKKRKVAPSREAEGSKKGRTLLLDYSTMAAYGGDEWLPRYKPLVKS